MTRLVQKIYEYDVEARLAISQAAYDVEARLAIGQAIYYTTWRCAWPSVGLHTTWRRARPLVGPYSIYEVEMCSAISQAVQKLLRMGLETAIILQAVP